jgi:hypothetical protein
MWGGMRKPARGLWSLSKSQIRWLLEASAGERQRPYPPPLPPPVELGETPSGGAHERRHDDGLRQRGGWSGPRSLQDERQYDLLVENEEPEELERLGRLHGFWIALATFAPTFLAIFFGIPYLAGLPVQTRSPSAPERSIPEVVFPLAGFVAALPQEPVEMMPSDTSTVAPAGRAGGPSRSPLTAAPETRGSDSDPMTAPAGARPAAQSRLQIKPVAAEPKRSVSTVTKDDSWLLAGAFADQGSAERLAASIERQGYPAKVRRHDATATPWVVWIGKQPRGMTPSERK